MKAFHSILIALCSVVPALADVPAIPFERYQIVIDRKPFGALPPPVAEVKAPTAPVDSFTKYYRVCSIVKEEDGSLTVGVVDNRGNKSVILKQDVPDPSGLTLIDANYEQENATLRMGEEIAVMDLRGTVSPAGGAPQAPQVTMAPPGAPQPPAPPNYADRRRLRQLQTQEPAQPPPQPKYTGEALQKHLQDYQMEVIRQGLPPLPIPLTPDQDSQLVKEGVLPPQ